MVEIVSVLYAICAAVAGCGPQAGVCRRAARCGLLLLVLAGLHGGTAAAGFVEVNGCSIATRLIDGVEFVPLARVVSVTGGRWWQVGNRFIVVLLPDSARGAAATGHEWVFEAGSQVAVCDGRQVVMPAPCRFAGEPARAEGLFVPVLGLAGVFPDVETPRVRALESTRRGDTVVIRLVLAQGRTWQGRAGGRSLNGGDGRGLQVMGRSSSSLEYKLSIGAVGDSSFDEQLRWFSVTGGCGIVKSVERDRESAMSLLFAFRQPAAETVMVRGDAVELRVWPRPARRVSRVLLDPGHGGEDPGAVGRLGTTEKRIALDIAQRIKRRLEGMGLQVIMTRDTDRYLSLADRTRMASQTGIDLFVSIHVNAAPNRKACGLETYFLSEAKTDWERAVAARENAALEPEVSGNGNLNDGISLILADLAQNEFLRESSEMAARIQEATLTATRMHDRGVRQANFYVLRNCFMPAVLVECGFITNRSEEKMLRKPEFRERVARGVSEGISTFVRQYERRLNGS